jgi:uncharacterized membrane protein YbhN (UPF0104 family)
MPIPDVTSFIARSVRGRGDWGWAGFVVGLVVVAAAGAVLFHMLRDIEPGRVFDIIQSMPTQTIALAACFVALGYVTLTFYDFFSLYTISRHHVPYRVAAMASFTSYSIGHNLGATVLTAGAVRWRIYSAWNLSLVDVAKMAFVTGLTFWLGNIVVLALSMITVPEAASAVDQLPPAVNRAVGIFSLVVIGIYLFWLVPRPRTIGRGTWSITLPGARLTLLQIGIGVLDLTVCGLAFYMLMPAAPAVDFATILVIYVTATLLGFLSHAPGSLGVFEAAVLIALPQFAKEELVASLLVFRCLYFVLPLLVAVGMMTARELMLASGR